MNESNYLYLYHLGIMNIQKKLFRLVTIPNKIKLEQ